MGAAARTKRAVHLSLTTAPAAANNDSSGSGSLACSLARWLVALPEHSRSLLCPTVDANRAHTCERTAPSVPHEQWHRLSRLVLSPAECLDRRPARRRTVHQASALSLRSLLPCMWLLPLCVVTGLCCDVFAFGLVCGLRPVFCVCLSVWSRRCCSRLVSALSAALPVPLPPISLSLFFFFFAVAPALSAWAMLRVPLPRVASLLSMLIIFRVFRTLRRSCG